MDKEKQLKALEEINGELEDISSYLQDFAKKIAKKNGTNKEKELDELQEINYELDHASSYLQDLKREIAKDNK